MMKTLTAQLVNALVLLFLAVPLFAQSPSATLSGLVKDAQGGVLPGVTITLRNTATDEIRTSRTDPDGWYRFAGLAWGTYSVSAALENFKTTTQSGLVLTVGESGRLDFRLEVGNIYETVKVTAQSALVNVEEARLTWVVNEQQVSDLPLNGRNVFQLVELQPGTLTNAVFTGPFSGSNANGDTPPINGQRNRSNNFLIDGIDNNDAWTAGRVALHPSVDMIEEFRVTTNNFSAEFGRNSGAVISVVTKSGTNNFHGTAYDFHRDNSLDARGLFATAADPPLHYNQFGGTSGGPVVKSRLFYFASYEGLRDTGGFTNFVTVETPEFRQQVAQLYPNSIANFLFQHFPSPTPTQDIMDVGQPRGGISFQSAGNDPSVATNPNYAPVGGGFYFNQLAATPDGIPDVGTAVVLDKFINSADQWSGRLDSPLSQSQHLFGRFIYDRQYSKIGGPDRNAEFIRPGGPHAQNLALGDIWIISPQTLVETRFGVSRENINFSQVDPGVPIITINDGTSAFGSSIIVHTVVDTFHLSSTVSKKVNNHGFKFGGEYRRVLSLVTGPSNRPNVAFQNIMDFAQDAVSALRSVGVNPGTGQIAPNTRNFRYNEVAGFIEDDWKVRSNLTLNLGLRWEWFGRPTERDGLLASLILGPGADIFAQVATATAAQVKQLMPQDYHNFGPRLGLSWDPTGGGKVAIRSGYGMMYDRLFGNVLENDRFNPPFYSTTSANPVFTPRQYGIPIPYGPTNPDGSRNPNVPLSLTGTDSNLGVASDSGVVGNLIAWNPAFGTSTQSVGIPDLHGSDAYIHSYFSGVQVDLGWNLGLEANYVGSVGRNLGIRVDYNTQQDSIQTFGFLKRPNPNFGGIVFRAMKGHSHYNGLQLQLKRRLAQGVRGQISYTHGKSMDDSSDVQTNTNATNPRNLNNDWGASDFDIRHRMVADLTWELPFFRGATGLRKSLLGGWQLNGITQYQSGFPFNVFTSASYPNGDFTGIGATNARPNLPSYGVHPSDTSKNAYINGFLNASDFPHPTGGVDGSLPRNAYRGPSFRQTDVSLFKKFALKENAQLQLRIESYNVFNNVNLQLQGFTGNLRSPLFAKATSTYGAREFQFALKLIY